MGTMELAWALGDLDGRSSNPQVVAFVNAALSDLTRSAPVATADRHASNPSIAAAAIPTETVVR